MAYNSLSTSNLPDPGVDPNAAEEPRDYFETFLYTGNGTGLQVGDVIKKPADTTTISNSLIFNDDDTAYLARTFSVEGNRDVWTWSAWVKRSNLGATQTLFSSYFGASVSGAFDFRFGSTDRLEVTAYTTTYLATNALYKDTSRWYHIVLRTETTNATADDRFRLWVDGIEVTSFATRNNPSSGQNTLNYSTQHTIGVYDNGLGQKFDGYIAEVHFVDGTAYEASDFGNFDANGIWIPKAVTGITYGTNGFYLDFSDNTSTTTLGADQTANGNDWTLNNLATTDQVTDSPTNNCPILWAERSTTAVDFSEGNRRMNLGSYDRSARTHRLPTSGKYYWELDIDLAGSGSNVGLHDCTLPVGNPAAASPNHTNSFRYNSNGNVLKDTTAVFSGTAYSSGAIAMFAVDFDEGLLWVGKDGTWFNSGDPANGTGYVSTLHPNVQYGINSVSSVADTTVILYTGQEAYNHTKPTGFASLTENNITVDDQNLESPDFVWIKNRDQADQHHWYDSVRGEQKALYPTATTLQTDEPNGLLDFNKNGFTIGSEVEVNTSGEDYVAWCWKAGGTASSNTDGSVTSTVSANSTSGISLVKWTVGSGTHTIGHGLGGTPDMLIHRSIDTAITQWWIWHVGLSNPQQSFIQFSSGAAGANTSAWVNTAPTSTVFTQNNYIHTAGAEAMAWCFRSVDGYSKFGSYIGNGSTSGSGPFVYTGFRPAFVIYKNSTDAGTSWQIFDSKRLPYNSSAYNILNAEANSAEATGTTTYGILHMYSNGFQLKYSGNDSNGSGDTFIYMAFAETPFKYSVAR